MAQKTLEKGSVWEEADTNGDGVVTDREMAIKERMVLLENRDKKEDQQRHLVWFSAITVTLFIIVLMTPLVPVDRISHIFRVLLKFGLLVIWEFWLLSLDLTNLQKEELKMIKYLKKLWAVIFPKKKAKRGRPKKK